MSELMENKLYPLHVFRYQVDFRERFIGGTSQGSKIVLCSGAFAEVSGLESSMEPKVIKEGGRNWGDIQRAGKTTFSTLVLKRGMTQTRDLWNWYEYVGTGSYAHRLDVVVTLFDTSGNSVLAWQLSNALPIKFKAADLNAKGTDVAIEELHLAHEGLSLVEKKDMLASLN